MSRPPDRTLLYRLIEAGQHAHRAALRPLAQRGLQPGDEAILFLAAGDEGVGAAELAAALSIGPRTLDQSLERLQARGLLTRTAVGPDLAPVVVLTERGNRVRLLLAQHWDALEAALLDGMRPKDGKKLAAALLRYTDELRGRG